MTTRRAPPPPPPSVRTSSNPYSSQLDDQASLPSSCTTAAAHVTLATAVLGIQTDAPIATTSSSGSSSSSSSSSSSTIRRKPPPTPAASAPTATPSSSSPSAAAAAAATTGSATTGSISTSSQGSLFLAKKAGGGPSESPHGRRLPPPPPPTVPEDSNNLDPCSHDKQVQGPWAIPDEVVLDEEELYQLRLTHIDKLICDLESLNQSQLGLEALCRSTFQIIEQNLVWIQDECGISVIANDVVLKMPVIDDDLDLFFNLLLSNYCSDTVLSAAISKSPAAMTIRRQSSACSIPPTLAAQSAASIHDSLYIVLSLLFHLGRSWIHAHERFLAHDRMLSLLKKVILNLRGTKPHPVAVKLMYEMCRDQELSISDLGKFDAPFFMELCEVIETGRQDRYEDFSFAVVRLLLLFNDQYTRKNSATLVLENLVVTTLSRRIHRSKTLSENIVFMFNRSPAMYTQVVIASSYPPYSPATTLSPGSGSSTSTASTTNDTGGSGGADAAFSEAADQMSVLKFLFLIFTTESLYQFFYTNDIKVIVDVVLREVERCDDEESLYAYLSLVSPLVLNTLYASTDNYKAGELLRVLNWIQGEGSFDLDRSNGSSNSGNSSNSHWRVLKLASKTLAEIGHILVP